MKTKTFLLISIGILFIVNLSFSQNNRKVGLSGTIQDNQYGILLPFWLGEKFVLAPAFDFKFVEGAGSDLSFGIVPRFYFKNESLAPYIGIKAGGILNIPSSNAVQNENKLDILAGLAFGAEYFLSDHFSFGVEAQGNFTKSDENSERFGNPGGLNFNTATMISATVYF